MHYNIYHRLKKQVSLDAGMTWNDVIPYEYQKGDFWYSAATCSQQTMATMYKWSGTSEVVSFDNGMTWEQTGEMMEVQQQQVPASITIFDGFDPDIPIDPATGITATTEEATENGQTPSVDYNSYWLYQKEYSSDGGNTWFPAYPYEYSASTEIAVENDPDCGYVNPDPIYRWVQTDGMICEEVEDERIYSWQPGPGYICMRSKKYTVELYCYSDDGGITWLPVEPEQARAGQLISNNSHDCNIQVTVLYEIDMNTAPAWIKVLNVYGSIDSAQMGLGDTVTLNRGAVKKEDVDPLGVFDLTFTVPGGVLFDMMFYDIIGVKQVTIKGGISGIGDKCFKYTSLESMEVLPNSCWMGDDALPSTISDIAVQDSRVDWYKQQYNWSDYASIIRAIS